MAKTKEINPDKIGALKFFSWNLRSVHPGIRGLRLLIYSVRIRMTKD